VETELRPYRPYKNERVIAARRSVIPSAEGLEAKRAGIVTQQKRLKSLIILRNKTNSVALSPRANYTD
jgi:hypothetical protein